VTDKTASPKLIPRGSGAEYFRWPAVKGLLSPLSMSYNNRMKNPAQPLTHLGGKRVSGGTVLLCVEACLLGLGPVGRRRMLRR
jgi:hypothetical protein